MNKSHKTIIIIATVLLVIVLLLVIKNKAASDNTNNSVETGPIIDLTDYKNTPFLIGDIIVQLSNGHFETVLLTDSASIYAVQYFGNEAKGDLNSDGREDVAYLVTQNSGGSGTFYYVVAALALENGHYQGTDAVLLGDRIAPQTTEIRDGQIIVNYAERRSGEAMTAEPTVGVSKYIEVEGAELVEIK